jgi:hypothetical protein
MTQGAIVVVRLDALRVSKHSLDPGDVDFALDHHRECVTRQHEG